MPALLCKRSYPFYGGQPQPQRGQKWHHYPTHYQRAQTVPLAELSCKKGAKQRGSQADKLEGGVYASLQALL